MLSLERGGDKETWLLTGYDEGEADESGRKPPASDPTQTSTPHFRTSLGAALKVRLDAVGIGVKENVPDTSPANDN